MAGASLCHLQHRPPPPKTRRHHHLALLTLLSLLAYLLFLASHTLQPSSSFDSGTSVSSVALYSPVPLSPIPTSPSLQVADLGSGSSLFSPFAPSPPPPPSSAPQLIPLPEAAVLESGSSSPLLPSPPGRDHPSKAAILAREVSPRRPKLEKRVTNGKCDLYSGSWVKDEEGRYPLYPPGQCPFVDSAFACTENGRKDMEYMKWRWKPGGCELPRFNATDFLERLRGKVLMFVGDSLSRNQFGSLLCLLREALPEKTRMYEKRGYKISRQLGYFTFDFPDYNCSVRYHRSYFLVSLETRLDSKGKTWATLHLDQIDKNAFRWKTADILIFNTGSWWNLAKTNSGKKFYQEGDTVYPRLSPNKAYRRGLRTWASWVENNLTPLQHTVFFRSSGTSHFRGGAWYSGGTCRKETQPAFRTRVLNPFLWKTKVVEEVISRMRFQATYLNVTKLTDFRKDAHPSTYGRASVVPGSSSGRTEDCSHWCLPGVPDTWNELLYANIVFQGGERYPRKK